MTGKLGIDWKRAVKYSWIAVCISLSQIGLGSYVLYPNYSFTNNDALLYLMLLSFPSSFPTVALTVSFIDVYPPDDYLIICFVAFISGYLQWFWCVPRLVRDREIVSLHLTSLERETQPVAATNQRLVQKQELVSLHLASHEKETQPIAAANPTRRRKSAKARFPRPPFDKSGRSPLERAIGINRG